jgi:hypothetical protein
MQPATTRTLFSFTEPQTGDAGDAVSRDSSAVRHFCGSVSQLEGMHEGEWQSPSRLAARETSQRSC